jgi:hypothetical protein
VARVFRAKMMEDRDDVKYRLNEDGGPSYPLFCLIAIVRTD